MEQPVIEIVSTLGLNLLPGHWEWLILLLLGLLVFGRRLPEVGRNIGKTVVEFRKGISDIEREVNEESSKRSRGELPSGERTGVRSDERAVPQESAQQGGVSTTDA